MLASPNSSGKTEMNLSKNWLPFISMAFYSVVKARMLNED